MGVKGAPAFFSYFPPELLNQLPSALLPHIRVYQDDILIGHESYEGVQDLVRQVSLILAADGCKINAEKSILTPTLSLYALGYFLQHNEVCMPEAQHEATLKLIDEALHQEAMTKRERAKLLLRFVPIREIFTVNCSFFYKFKLSFVVL